MKNELILVTGGARSGKSAYAEALLNDCRNKFYLATAPKLDGEMLRRVALHQARRAAAGNWTTIEEETDLAGALRRAGESGADGVLIDCLTVWLGNLLYAKPDFQEADVKEVFSPVLEEARAFPWRCVMVINEVGCGIVPETPQGRIFRDISGRCGQLAAAAADQVTWMTCGLPLAVKGGE